jgi:hypothetical protein
MRNINVNVLRYNVERGDFKCYVWRIKKLNTSPTKANWVKMGFKRWIAFHLPQDELGVSFQKRTKMNWEFLKKKKE